MAKLPPVDDFKTVIERAILDNCQVDPVSAHYSAENILAQLGSQWQPIETAPRDGTRILVHVPSDDDGMPIRIASWRHRGRANLCPWQLGYGSFCADSAIDGWMPLPEPTLNQNPVDSPPSQD